MIKIQLNNCLMILAGNIFEKLKLNQMIKEKKYVRTGKKILGDR